MRINRKIRKIGILALWLVLGSGLLLLLAAAMKNKDLKSCSGVEINISGIDGDFCFLDKKDVLKAIGVTGTNKAEGRNVASFNLQTLESSIEKNVWVKDAELFFDNNLLLHVNIEERQPVSGYQMLWVTHSISTVVEACYHLMIK